VHLLSLGLLAENTAIRQVYLIFGCLDRRGVYSGRRSSLVQSLQSELAKISFATGL